MKNRQLPWLSGQKTRAQWSRGFEPQKLNGGGRKSMIALLSTFWEPYAVSHSTSGHHGTDNGSLNQWIGVKITLSLLKIYLSLLEKGNRFVSGWHADWPPTRTWPRQPETTSVPSKDNKVTRKLPSAVHTYPVLLSWTPVECCVSYWWICSCWWQRSLLEFYKRQCIRWPRPVGTLHLYYTPERMSSFD